MKNILKLSNPLKVNGVDTYELAYDTDEITPLLFAQAEAMQKQATQANLSKSKSVPFTPAAEFDFSLHVYFGIAAILAVNPQLDAMDLERIKGRDVVEVMQIGRNFILKSDASAPSNSDDASETTAEPSQQA